jgi:hypothetical protein
MTSTKLLTASERYARFILSAWNQREFTELESAIEQSPFLQTGTLRFEECERIELIHDLGRNLLTWDNSGQGENKTDQNTALAILRHLARCH